MSTFGESVRRQGPRGPCWQTVGSESGQIYWEQVVEAWAQQLKIYLVGNGEALLGFEQMNHTARGIVGRLIWC